MSEKKCYNAHSPKFRVKGGFRRFHFSMGSDRTNNNAVF